MVRRMTDRQRKAMFARLKFQRDIERSRGKILSLSGKVSPIKRVIVPTGRRGAVLRTGSAVVESAAFFTRRRFSQLPDKALRKINTAKVGFTPVESNIARDILKSREVRTTPK